MVNVVSRSPLSVRLVQASANLFEQGGHFANPAALLVGMGVKTDAAARFSRQFISNDNHGPFSTYSGPFLDVHRAIQSGQIKVDELGPDNLEGLPSDDKIIEVLGPNSLIERGGSSWQGDQRVDAPVSQERVLEILGMRRVEQGFPGLPFHVRSTDTLDGARLRDDTQMHNVITWRWNIPRTIEFFNQKMAALNAGVFALALRNGAEIVMRDQFITGGRVEIRISEHANGCPVVQYLYYPVPHFIGDPERGENILQ